MSSTFFGLHVAGSGLNAASANINTTANNVSNADTKGYSRQVVNVSESSSLRAYTRYGSVSTGVSTDSVTRERDQYYNQKYWENQSDYGYASEKKYYMDQIEQYFTDSASNPGFSTVFAKMFNSLDSLKSNSGDTTYRTNFISTAKQLTSYFNQTSNNLANMQTSVNDDIKTYVDRINSIAQKISVINSKINVVETGYGRPTANELRDEREKLIDELSEIISVDTDEVQVKDARSVREHAKNKNVEEVWNGATYFSIKVNGQLLVDGDSYNALTVQTRDNRYNQSDVEGLYDVVWKKDGTSFPVWGNTQRGILRGLFEIRDGNDLENMSGTAELFYPQTYTLGNNTTAQAEGTEDPASGNIFTNDATKAGQLVRDPYGNLVQNLKNTTNAFIKMTLPSGGMAADELSLPANGTVWVNNHSYNYSGFTAQTDDTGKVISVIFELEDKIPSSQVGHIAGNTMTVGTSIDFKGIPYYQKQMNTFVRSLSRAFNKIEKMGQDANGDVGQALFVANDKSMNREGNFQLEGDGTDKTYIDSEYYEYERAEGKITRQTAGTGTTAIYKDANDNVVDEYGYRLNDAKERIPVYEYEYQTNPDGSIKYEDKKDSKGNTVYDRLGNPVQVPAKKEIKTDSNGNPIQKVNAARETTHADGLIYDKDTGKVTYYGGVIRDTDDTYYRLTADNFSIASAVERDPNKLSTTINKAYDENLNLGQDAYDLMNEMKKLQSGVKMYRGGTADKFLERIYADVSVDTQECNTFTENYKTIQQAVDKQRQSVSGVDEDEEALNLMKYQQAYNLSAKVISTLTEMYDQLILNTGV
jgi:flagellar hook-associated protein 1 FlgK